MAQRTLRFASRGSLHARPAALFSQAAAGSGVPVRIAKGDASPVDAASILQVLVPGQRRQGFHRRSRSGWLSNCRARTAHDVHGQNASCLARRRPAVDQRLARASQQCANSLLVSRQESSSMMIPVTVLSLKRSRGSRRPAQRIPLAGCCVRPPGRSLSDDPCACRTARRF
jgi:phosphotransferase system HPr (HPr) family protein